MQRGTIVQILTAPAAGEPMVKNQRIEAVRGIGLADDRYALGTGAWSREKRRTIRHVSFIEEEVIEAVWQEYGLQLTAEIARRNIVTRGIRLNDAVGHIVLVGPTVILRGVERCDPCKRPGKLSSDPAMKEKLEEALQGRGGLRAEVIVGGIVSIDDPIVVVDEGRFVPIQSRRL